MSPPFVFAETSNSNPDARNDELPATWRHYMIRKLSVTMAVVAANLLLVSCDNESAPPSGPLTAAPREAVQAPNPPIIWLHYDYMVRADGFSYAPDPRSLQLVIDAFRARGITLHIDPRHTEIPEADILVFGPGFIPPACPAHAGKTFVSFQALKAQYFQPKGSQPWHYVIFGRYGERSQDFCNLLSGAADVGGYDFMVTNGLTEENVPDFWARFRPYLEGGVFMHELGHNIGLLHGGDEWMDHKPNYFSVMNAEGTFGILVADAPGSTNTTSLRIDYSGEALPTLDESSLDEARGLGGAASNTDIARVLRCGDINGIARIPATGPIDWNCNGVIEGSVSQIITLNHLEPNSDGFAVMRGFNDWAYVHQVLRTPAYVNGVLRSRGVAP
jgi:hypothetical protein